MDGTIDRDVPSTYNLYICPYGLARINGQEPNLKKAYAYYPSKTGPASPDCAWIKADGQNVRVEVGPIFQRDEAQRHHDLPLKRLGG